MDCETEDVIVYRIYFNQCDVDEQYLCAALSTFMQHAESETRGYIWQSERFGLRISNSSSSVPHLCGRTHFGECVADEWLITYLLFELTRLHPELAVTVEDSDGHFLLIEAAHAIPRWLNERTAKNRVFVHRGELHIIPQPQHPGEVGLLPVGEPSIGNALQLLYGDFPTVASPTVQSWLKRKLECYPGEIGRSRHVAHCILPLPAAHVLSLNPALVAPAVQTFYQRDPLQLKACKRMRFFPPAPSVRCSVVFSRLLYAQLRQQKFTPHKLSSWRHPVANRADACAYDLGMKLSHGLEILCAQASPQKSASTPADEDTVCNGMRWERFLHCLKERDYFHGELEGSQLYTKLLSSAKTYFSSSFGGEQRNFESWQKSAGGKVLDILHSIPMDEEHLRESEKDLRPADDDSWIEVTSEQLDDLLKEYSVQLENAVSSTSLSGEQQLDEMVMSMNHFVLAMSGHEGVEVPPKEGKTQVDFDADMFSNALTSVLNIAGKGTANTELDLSNSDDDVEDDDDDFEDSNSETAFVGSADGESESATMKAYMASMDSELARTDLVKSFDRVQTETMHEKEQTNGVASSEAELPPVNIDMNLVKNLLKSYSSQQGLAGPVTNILHSMGVSIPPDDDSSNVN